MNDLEKKLRALLEEGFPTQQWGTSDIDQSLDSTGMDSLEFIEVIYIIEDGFGIECDQNRLGDIRTLRDLLDMIEDELREVPHE